MNAKTTLLVIVLMAACAALAETGRVLPQGTEIKVRTDTPIPAKPVANAKYTATVSDDVLNSSGSVGIPRHSRAQRRSVGFVIVCEKFVFQLGHVHVGRTLGLTTFTFEAEVKCVVKILAGEFFGWQLSRQDLTH